MATNGTAHVGTEQRLFPWTRDASKGERRAKTHRYVPSPLLNKTMKQVGGITSDLRRDPGAIIEVPGGTQLGVAYAGGCLELTADFGSHKGSVRSGSEWVFVRRDGVVLIDARVTIAFPKEVDRIDGKPVFEDVLMDMTLKGTIDLKDTFDEVKGEVAYRKYKDGTTEPVLVQAKDPADAQSTDRFFHNFTGSARFEGGNGPVDSDYSDHFVTSAGFGKLKKLDLLVRQQFNVVGKVFINKVPHYDPTGISLAVWSWG
jgi:hypothetical protein